MTSNVVIPNAVVMADELRHADIGSVVLWLSNAARGVVSPEVRRDVATRVLVASVWQQAGVLGLVRCTRCGDRGCDWCRARWPMVGRFTEVW